MARLVVVRETAAGERRVAATPETVRKFVEANVDVTVVDGAGAAAGIDNAQFVDAGAQIADDRAISDAAVVVSVAPPSAELVALLAPGTLLVSFTAPHRNLDTVQALAAANITTLSMELIPRISRAQSMDALSSQANLSGYRSVIVAAYQLDKYFPLFMTAAGTIRPATVVVLGAGVAGLQAVATAKRLGAIVKVSDIREAAKQEVASLGATFIDVPDAEDLTGEGGYAQEVDDDFLERQRAALTDAVASAHAVITTAQIPLRPAPELLTQAMVEAMPAGGVVIDLAAADGGNCVLTDTERVIDHEGVRIVPGHDFPSHMPAEASALYARNIHALLSQVLDNGDVTIDTTDEVVAGSLLTHDGGIVNERIAAMLTGGGV
ncbi:MAG: NAD(P) transhydrogenase subunit alpha [Nitriliruptoraceae bacterium]